MPDQQTKTYPPFSVLMTVYRRDDPTFVKQAIETTLNQTVKPSEFVIIKDGPLTPELEEALAPYADDPLFKIDGFEVNKGLGLALNYGVTQCKYDLIARMDADDICPPYRFERELDCMAEKGVDMVGSMTHEFIDTIDNVQCIRYLPETNEEIVAFAKTRCPFAHSSVIFKKEALLDAGNYQDCYLCEDFDMWIRFLEKGHTAYNIQEPMVYMRVGKDFYRRRGGIKYCKSIVGFKKRMYKKGFMSRGQYLKTKYATIFVALMPGFLREFVYRKFLRGRKV